MDQDGEVLPLLHKILQQLHALESLELWDDNAVDVFAQFVPEIVVELWSLVQFIAESEHHSDKEEFSK